MCGPAVACLLNLEVPAIAHPLSVMVLDVALRSPLGVLEEQPDVCVCALPSSSTYASSVLRGRHIGWCRPCLGLGRVCPSLGVHGVLQGVLNGMVLHWTGFLLHHLFASPDVPSLAGSGVWLALRGHAADGSVLRYFIVVPFLSQCLWWCPHAG